MTHLIRATNLRGYDDLVKQKGHNPLPLLEKYNIPPAGTRYDSAFLTYKNVVSLLEESAKVLNFPDIGLRLAEFQGLDILGPISVIARSSSTVGEAIKSISRYIHLHSPALQISNTVCSIGSQIAARFEFVIDNTGSVGYFSQSYELSLSNSIQAMKLLCGHNFKPISIHFKHAQIADEKAYQDIFECPVLFNQNWSGIIWPIESFNLPLSSADHQTWQLAEQYLASQQPPNATSFAEDVRQLINTLLPTGQCNNTVVASHFSMDKRTLQRKLAKEGTHFTELVNSEKMKLTHKYLLEPDLKLSQIAGLLGYSEQSSFNRACRDWFDKTPLQYRKQNEHTQLGNQSEKIICRN